MFIQFSLFGYTITDDSRCQCYLHAQFALLIKLASILNMVNSLILIYKTVEKTLDKYYKKMVKSKSLLEVEDIQSRNGLL